MGMRINSKYYRKATRKVERYVENRLPRLALKEFKSNTPVARPPPAGTVGGNARRKTKLKKKVNGFEIIANYDYSGVIDQGGYPKNPKGGYNKTTSGFSNQAPKGLVGPTLDFITTKIKKFIRRNR